MNLTPHFTLAELTASDYAIRNGLDNHPTDPAVLDNLHTLADLLEQVRHRIGRPIHVTSAYRSEKINQAIGGARSSAHLKGLAADIVVPGISAREVSLAIANDPAIDFDQVIFEGTWTHVSAPPTGAHARRQILTAIFKPGRPPAYVSGLA